MAFTEVAKIINLAATTPLKSHRKIKFNKIKKLKIDLKFNLRGVVAAKFMIFATLVNAILRLG